MKKYQVLIIGGGTAGITVAAQLKKKNSKLTVGIIEPSDKHVYQPAWTLVGGGTYDFNKTIRKEKNYIPSGVDWIKDYAQKLNPSSNEVVLKKGESIGYEYLIVAPGLKIDLSKIEGLEKAIGKNGVCSNYIDPMYSWKTLQEFKGGVAISAQASTPIKCGGAPQKWAYLTANHLKKNNLLNKTELLYIMPGSAIFGVPVFRDTLLKVVERYGMGLRFFHHIEKVDGENKTIYYKFNVPEGKDIEFNMPKNNSIKQIGENQISIQYDMLHIAPPQTAPDFVADSELAHKEGASKGWMDVDVKTLKSNVFENVFGLGDVSALPTAKTGAAVRKQAPVVVQNLLDLMAGKELKAEYDGYSSCPIVTSDHTMLLAEFGYENERMSDPLITKFVDTTKEKWSMWLLKKYGLPFMYWNLMLKGKA